MEYEMKLSFTHEYCLLKYALGVINNRAMFKLSWKEN